MGNNVRTVYISAGTTYRVRKTQPLPNWPSFLWNQKDGQVHYLAKDPIHLRLRESVALDTFEELRQASPPYHLLRTATEHEMFAPENLEWPIAEEIPSISDWVLTPIRGFKMAYTKARSSAERSDNGDAPRQTIYYMLGGSVVLFTLIAGGVALSAILG